MLSCKQAVELVSKALDTPLIWRERMALRFHLWMCRMCRRYARQLRLLERICAALQAEDFLPNRGLSPKARARILEQLNHER